MTTANNPAAGINPIAYAMKNYAEYNLWANTTMVNWLKTKPAEALEQEVLSSFKGIKPTLVHIWQTQCYWLSVIEHTTYIPQEFTGTVQEVMEEIVKQSAAFAAYVQSLAAGAFEQCTEISNPWFTCNLPAFEYIIQVMNHSTYHRGQVVTIGHHLGFRDAPMTDYNYYNVMAGTTAAGSVS